MSNNTKNAKHFYEDRRAHLSMLATLISTLVLLVGMAWKQATWQAEIGAAVISIRGSQEVILQNVANNGVLIKLNTIRLSELENKLDDGVMRESLYAWLLTLQEKNPKIKVPLLPAQLIHTR